MKTVAAPVLIGRGLVFSEGVNFDRDGTLYCVDVQGGGVWRMPPGGELREWVHTGGGPNGSRFGPEGDLFVADCGRTAILRLDTSTGGIIVYADQYAGRPFNGPNDLCFGPGNRSDCSMGRGRGVGHGARDANGRSTILCA